MFRKQTKVIFYRIEIDFLIFHLILNDIHIVFILSDFYVITRNGVACLIIMKTENLCTRVQDEAKNEIGKETITILGKRDVRVARNEKGEMRYIFGEIDDWHDRRCLDECRYFVL